jgi:hypothetical protein
VAAPVLATCIGIDIGAAVGRVGEDAIEGSITDGFPKDIAVRSSGRQIQPLSREPQQRLSNGGSRSSTLWLLILSLEPDAPLATDRES